MKRNRGGARLALACCRDADADGRYTGARAGNQVQPGSGCRERNDAAAEGLRSKPTVHLAQHDAPRAKFYVIDVHNHVNDPGGVHGDEVPAADVVKAMDQANLKRS